jgi:hypothetical protein
LTVQGVQHGDTFSVVDPSDTTLPSATAYITPPASPPAGTALISVQVGNCSPSSP